MGGKHFTGIHVINLGAPEEEIRDIIKMVSELFGVELPDTMVLNEELAKWAEPLRNVLKVYGLSIPKSCKCGTHGVEHYMDDNLIISVMLPVAQAESKGFLHADMFNCVVKLSNDTFGLIKHHCRTVDELKTALNITLGIKHRKPD